MVSYLDKLQFDQKTENSFIAKYLKRLRLAILILLGIVFLGVSSYISLPRNVIPDIKIPLVIISAVLPGAGPKDIEQLVTVPLEDAVRGVQDIQTIQSSSQDSVSVTTIQFNSGVNPDKALTDIQTAVNSVTTLPSDTLTPKVQKLDFQNTPVWTFNLAGSADSASLFRFADQLKRSLEDLKEIDRVTISGSESQEVQLLIKPEAVNTYKINPLQISSLINTSLKALPAGIVKTESSTFSLSIDPAVVTIDDIRNLKINLNGSTIALSDIVNVSDKSKPEQPASYVITKSSKPERAVTFDVYRLSGGNIEKTVEAAKKEVNSQISKYNNQFSIYSINDSGDSISKLFSKLQTDFIRTILLVTIILFIFLGVRQSLVSSFTAPIVFFITFFVMKSLGISLSFIAIFSLLLALGLLVDDTIVIISATTAYYRTGRFTPLQTGLLVWKDFLLPVLTTTITTVFAFLPLIVSSGIIGEFIKPVPIVVSTTLIASFFTALFITFPAILFLLNPKAPKRVIKALRYIAVLITLITFYVLVPKDDLTLLTVLAFTVFLLITYQLRFTLLEKFKAKITLTPNRHISTDKIKNIAENGLVSFTNLSGIYKNVIHSILQSPSARKKTVLMVVVFSIFAFLLLPFGLVKNEFFPKTDQNVLYITVELPAGSNLETTNSESLNLLEQLKNTPEAEFITGNVGKTVGGFGSSSGGTNNNILLSINLTDSEKRKIPSFDIANLLRTQFKNYQKGRLLVQEASGGPPVGADVQIKLFGPDLNTLDSYANKIVDNLNSNKGITNVQKSIKPGTGKIVFIPNQEKMAAANITLDQVSFWLRFFASGFSTSKIQLEEGKDKQDISLRIISGIQKVEDISTITIPSNTGNIPISELGKLQLEPNPTLITREAFNRTISITASVNKGYSIPQENSDLGKFANSLKLPSGYSWQTGGANEENQKSISSLLQAMLISFLLIIVTMVIQFDSLRRAFIVMLVIPLSIAGVFVIFALTQTELTFPALIGVLALFGIVVKNSILIVDKIIANQNIGMDFTESISDASSSRLEPIALTSLTAIFGLIPITLSDPLWRGLGGAIIAGLTFSGTIMLFFIPVVYYYMFEPKNNPS